jgi:hypothetical protein
MPVNGGLNWIGITGSADGTKLAAITGDGYIYTSANSGSLWVPRVGPGRKQWSSIASSADGSVILASALLSISGTNETDPAFYDYVYLSTDSGFTFTKQTALGANNWTTVLVSDDGMTLLAVPDYSPNISISTDGGKNWQAKTPYPYDDWSSGDAWYSSGMSADGRDIILNGYTNEHGSIIFVSTDSGSTWIEKPGQTETNIYFDSKPILSGSYLYEEGNYNGEIDLFVSTDLATSWTKLPGIVYPNASIIKAVGNGQDIYSLTYSNSTSHVEIYYSSNYGQDWSLLKSFDEAEDYYPADLTVSDDHSKIALALSNAYIFTSTDSGDSWTKQDNGTIGGMWTSVGFSSDGQKLLVGTDISPESLPQYSLDGGGTWAKTSFSAPNISTGVGPYLISPDGSQMIISIPSIIDGVYSGTHLFSTTNPENGWTNIDSLSMKQVWQGFSYSPGSSTLYGVNNMDDGSAGYVYSSNNWGMSWTQLTSAGSRSWERVVSSNDGSKIMAIRDWGGSAENYIYYSNDSGSTWDSLSSAGKKNWVSVSMSSDGSIRYAAEGSGYIYRSTNNGSTWTRLDGAGAKQWKAISASSDGTKLIAAAFGPIGLSDLDYIYTSIDSGDTWTQEVSLGGGHWNDAKISPDGTKFIVADSIGFVYTGSSDDILSSISSTLAVLGITTNLGEIENQSQACNLYFEKEGVGKIEFLTCPDLTDPTVISWIKNLNNLLNLSLKTIGLDADMVQGLISTQATLTMYNIDMANPQILVDNAPDTQGVVSDFVYDKNLHTITFNASHFTTFTAVEGSSSSNNTTPSSNSDSNQSSNITSNSTLSCSDSKPISTPDLFQIDTGKTTAKLFFTPINNTNNYYISFSTSPNAEEFGTGVITLSRKGVQNFTVSSLKPNTTYYFKVRGQLGCMPGDWSNIMKIKTDNKKYYKNQTAQLISNTTPTFNNKTSTTNTGNGTVFIKPDNGIQSPPNQPTSPSINNTNSNQNAKPNLWQKIINFLSNLL